MTHVNENWLACKTLTPISFHTSQKQDLKLITFVGLNYKEIVANFLILLFWYYTSSRHFNQGYQ